MQDWPDRLDQDDCRPRSSISAHKIGISAETTEEHTAGSGAKTNIVTRATGLAEPLFGSYRVSAQHEIKPGNTFYPSIANLDGTLYVIQGSGDALFIQTPDSKTLTAGELEYEKDIGNRALTYPPGVNDIRAFDGKLYFSTTCAWDSRAEGLGKNAGLVALLFSYDPKVGSESEAYFSPWSLGRSGR